MTNFKPVVVNGGRKFRGECYLIPGGYTSSYGYRNSGICPLTFTDHAKIWDPISGKVSYVNEKFVEDRIVDEAVVKADLVKYSDGVIASTIEWCRSKSVGKSEDEVMRFAYNVIRKNHPEMVVVFEEKYSYREDIADVVMSTINWAFGLGYRADKCVRIAYRALSKKGVVTKPAFNASWTMGLDLRGCGKYAAKYAA